MEVLKDEEGNVGIILSENQAIALMMLLGNTSGKQRGDSIRDGWDDYDDTKARKVITEILYEAKENNLFYKLAALYE